MCTSAGETVLRYLYVVILQRNSPMSLIWLQWEAAWLAALLLVLLPLGGLSAMNERGREREREREFNLSIQPPLAYEDMSMLESSAKARRVAKQ